MVSDEVYAHRARVTSVVTSALDSLNLDWETIREILHAAERGGRVLQLTTKGQKRWLARLCLLATIDWQVNH